MLIQTTVPLFKRLSMFSDGEAMRRVTSLSVLNCIFRTFFDWHQLQPHGKVSAGYPDPSCQSAYSQDVLYSIEIGLS